MEVIQAISQRRSIRAYRPDPITKAQLLRFVEAVRLAPSWKDRQCWSLVVLTDREQIMALGERMRFNPGRTVYETAPCFVLFVADPAQSGVRDDKPYYMTDIGICMENAVLAATEMGLGTCWVGSFTEDPIRELLHIPAEQRIVAMTPLGVPAEAPAPRPRKEPGEFVYHGAWGVPLQA